jgi:hypothetical protein
MVFDAWSQYPFWFVILVYIQQYFSQYWYILFPAMASIIPMLLIKLFAFPLLTRNPAELILIFGPRKVTVLRRISGYLPYFAFKQRMYWFAEPHQVGNNLLHLYFEGLNQPITHLERNQDKEKDIISLREFNKQTASHNIRIPPSLKSFIRSWALIIDETTVVDGKPVISLELVPSRVAKVPQKQSYNIGVLKRIGLYRRMNKVAEGETSSGTANQELVTLTVQKVQEKLGDVVKGTNFSSRLAWKILKRTRDLELNWVRWLLGEFDWRIIMLALLIIVAFVGIWFISNSFSPGPAPAGVPTGK